MIKYAMAAYFVVLLIVVFLLSQLVIHVGIPLFDGIVDRVDHAIEYKKDD